MVTDAPLVDFKLPKYWPRCWALDIDKTNASVLWTAHDRESDVLYIYSELIVPRYDLTKVADAIRVRSRGYPGLFDHLARGRSQQEGERIIQALLDLHLEVFTPQVDPDAAVAEVTHRLMTKRLKVFASSCPQWLAQYRAYRRDKDGEIVEESDGLMRAMDLLVMWAPQTAALDDESVKQAEDDWAAKTRSSVTGY
jgi:hypothetical protein